MDKFFSQAKNFLKQQISRDGLRVRNPEEKWKYSLAYLISRILSPTVLIIAVWLITAWKSGIGFWKAIWVYPLILLISIASPLAVTTYLVAARKVPNIEWSDLADRKKYLFPIGLAADSLLLFLVWWLTNKTTFHLTLVLYVIMSLWLFINRFFNFKISMHVILASIALATVNLYFHYKFLWLYFLLIPLIWARYVLKVHSLAELLAGLILSNGLIFLALLLFGLPQVPQP